MKNLKTLLFIFLTLSLFSCTQKSPEKLLVGNWKFSNILYEIEISPENKPIIESNLEALRQSFSIDYYTDKKYHSHSIKDEKGTWKLNSADSVLVHTDADGEQRYKVLKLTDDSLFVKTTLQGQTLTIQFVRGK
ncbi:MAG: lipocalin family protein [Chitinophagales bacterium]|nr:lipocalin family protein [Chitinophagales bacterium]MCO5280283.1 lipocalin family protein [Chitinophagales bacterium]HRN94849.1 lipocalin family protein [Chitinophagales bacterium]HRP39451.1 lipocalin family protein [Chitinophagales bacterium]